VLGVGDQAARFRIVAPCCRISPAIEMLRRLECYSRLQNLDPMAETISRRTAGGRGIVIQETGLAAVSWEKLCVSSRYLVFASRIGRNSGDLQGRICRLARPEAMAENKS